MLNPNLTVPPAREGNQVPQALAPGGNLPGTRTDDQTAHHPRTYLDLYLSRGDHLAGNYATLYERFNNRDAGVAQVLLAHVRSTSTDTRVPRVFLALVTKQGSPKVVCIHRPVSYPKGVTPSIYDGRTFAFLGDVLSGQHIEVVELREEHFALSELTQARTTAETDIAIATTEENLPILPPIEDDEQGENVRARTLCPVPFPYLPLVLGKEEHSPRELWLELAGAIQNDSREEQLRPLLQWLQIAVSTLEDPDDPDSIIMPPTSLGDEGRAFPATRAQEIHDLRQQVLRADFPMWYAPTQSNDGRLSDLLNVFRQENERSRAEAAAERQATKDPKLPSDKFKWAVRRFKAAAGVDDERDLPPIYAALANAQKGELRLCLQEHVDARAREGDSPSLGSAVVTKELLEMVIRGQLGSELQVDDLTAGLSPFTCGFGTGPKTQQIQARVEAYDTAQAGDSRPSVAEQTLFATKEVVLPDDPFLFQQMLACTSLVLDVVQGTTHPHATGFRKFVAQDVPVILAHLQTRAPEDQAAAGNVYPRVLREIQLLQNGYFSTLMDGGEPSLPEYGAIRTLLHRQKYRDLPDLPAAYRIATPPSHPGGRARNPAGGTGGTGNIAARLGQPVPNAQPTKRDWQTKFQASGKTVKQLREHAPKDTQGTEVCLAYHLKGQCYDNCGRKATHKVLTGNLKTQFQKFVDEHISPPSTGAGTPAPANDRPADSAGTLAQV